MAKPGQNPDEFLKRALIKKPELNEIEYLKNSQIFSQKTKTGLQRISVLIPFEYDKITFYAEVNADFAPYTNLKQKMLSAVRTQKERLYLLKEDYFEFARSLAGPQIAMKIRYEEGIWLNTIGVNSLLYIQEIFNKSDKSEYEILKEMMLQEKLGEIIKKERGI